MVEDFEAIPLTVFQINRHFGRSRFRVACLDARRIGMASPTPRSKDVKKKEDDIDLSAGAAAIKEGRR